MLESKLSEGDVGPALSSQTVAFIFATGKATWFALTCENKPMDRLLLIVLAHLLLGILARGETAPEKIIGKLAKFVIETIRRS